MSLDEASSQVFPLRPPYPHYVSELLGSGRAISVAMIAVVLLVNFRILPKILGIRTPAIPKIIFLIQLLLCAKLVAYGSYGFAVASVIVLAVQIFFLLKVAVYWNAKSNGSFMPKMIALCASMALALNGFLLWLYPSAAYIDQERLVGSMPNPQHLMLFLTLMLPAVLFMISRATSMKCRLMYVAQVLFLMFLVEQTGSRIGVATLVAISVIYFSSLRFDARVLLAVGGFLIIAAVYEQTAGHGLSQFFLERGDTRGYVWLGEWDRFLQYPLWGVPLGEGGRFVYYENAWLSFLSNGGIVAALLLLSVVGILLRKVLFLLRRWQTGNANYTFALSCVLCVFFLSLFESVFDGTYSSFALLSFFCLSIPLAGTPVKPAWRPNLRFHPKSA